MVIRCTKEQLLEIIQKELMNNKITQKEKKAKSEE
jgi:hypothetical protein